MTNAKCKYPELANELVRLLEDDQSEKRKIGQIYFASIIDPQFEIMQKKYIKNSGLRIKRVIDILGHIKLPYISNVGIAGSEAITVLMLHSKLSDMKNALKLFQECYLTDKENVYYQGIPALVDLIAVLEHKPQIYGTQWFWDKAKQPFLPPVEDFAHVNERRNEYGLTSLRWPKSLAIDDSKQPWLKKPFSEIEMREPTDTEFEDFSKPYL